MKIQNTIKAACAALLFGLASQASANVISVDASGLSNGYLSNGTYNGSFNAGSLLPKQFIVNSIGFTFSFADDTDPYTSTFKFVSQTPLKAGAAVNVPGTNGDKSITSTTTLNQTEKREGATESVVLAFGAGSITFDGSTLGKSVFSQTNVKGNPVLTSTVSQQGSSGKSCTAGSPNCKTTYYYTVTTTNTDVELTNAGNFDITKTFSKDFQSQAFNTLLAELTSNKSLNFSLGVSGDLILTGATLDIDYSIPQPPSNNVPEPASLALFGIALAGIAGARRARRG